MLESRTNDLFQESFNPENAFSLLSDTSRNDPDAQLIFHEVHKICEQVIEYFDYIRTKGFPEHTLIKFFRTSASNLVKRANYSSLSEYLEAHAKQKSYYKYLLQFKSSPNMDYFDHQRLIDINENLEWNKLILGFTNEEMIIPFHSKLDIQLINSFDGSPYMLYFYQK